VVRALDGLYSVDCSVDGDDTGSVRRRETRCGAQQ
jgi:hypothetical protein